MISPFEEIMDLILYHAQCPDGWTAAYVAKQKYPGAELVPLKHGLSPEALDDLFKMCFHNDVLMLDYSLSTRELNDQMANVAKSFHIYDHHRTSQTVLEGADYATFDMKRSGAGLAWDYLFGKDAHGFLLSDPIHRAEHLQGTRPFWVNYVEDQDLWNWALPKSHEINAYLMTMPRTVEAWDAITKHDTVETAELGGIGVRRYIEYYTRCVVAEKQEGIITFEGRNYRTAVLNIPYAGVSEAGNALCKEGYEIGLAWFERGDGIIQFSLRSEGDIDVSGIAKFYGGGGHQHAAGFQLSIEKGRALVDKILGRTNVIQTPCWC
jgi:oligoribonuclease NrnB/cAMP/cGMP phosphodiesterase (DHH superfamily)